MRHPDIPLPESNAIAAGAGWALSPAETGLSASFHRHSFVDQRSRLRDTCSGLASFVICTTCLLGLFLGLKGGNIDRSPDESEIKLQTFHAKDPPRPIPHEQPRQRSRIAKRAPSSSPSPSKKRAAESESSPPPLSSPPLSLHPNVIAIAPIALPDAGIMPIGDASGTTGKSAGQGQDAGTGGGDGHGHGRGGSRAIRLAGAQWIREPDRHALNAAESPEARSKHILGRAVLSCLIDDHGNAKICSLLKETPTGYNFGQAAMELYPTFRIRPVRANGKPRLDLPIFVTLNFLN